MTTRRVVALLDDDEVFCRQAVDALDSEFDLRAFTRAADLYDALRTEEPDVLLLDLDLGEEEDGFSVHRRLRAQGFSFPVVLLTIYAGTRTTAQALAQGIPYLNKDERLDAATLRREVGGAVHHSLLAAEVRHYRGLLDTAPALEECPWPDSASSRRVRAQLETLAASQGPVLLAGERGTGKLTAARWVHAASGRRDPFYAITARGRDPEDFERQLYGSVTPQGGGDSGALGAAALGSVFIQGLETLPEGSLERLRLALTSGTYIPAGGTRGRRLTARVLASRLTDPESGAAGWSPSVEGFWQPYTVVLPSLRERPEDLEYHARCIARVEGCPGAQGLGKLAPEDLSLLRTQPLPGNLFDLRLAVLFGMDAVAAVRLAGDAADDDGILRVEELSRLPYAAAHDRFELAYLRAVAKRLGRDAEAWIRHTCYARASVYRWFKRLEE